MLTIKTILVKKRVNNLPKCYSDSEREYIRKRLKEEAAACMGQHGIRRTTVDEIVKRVKIPKGTFYLFYQSKELLLFDVILEQHESVNRQLYQAVSDIAGPDFSAEKLTEVIFRFFKMTEELPLLKRLNPEDVELLARRLPGALRSREKHAAKNIAGDAPGLSGLCDGKRHGMQTARP